jgi:hypothetical protein
MGIAVGTPNGEIGPKTPVLLTFGHFQGGFALTRGLRRL